MRAFFFSLEHSCSCVIGLFFSHIVFPNSELKIQEENSSLCCSIDSLQEKNVLKHQNPKFKKNLGKGEELKQKFYLVNKILTRTVTNYVDLVFSVYLPFLVLKCKIILKICIFS